MSTYTCPKCGAEHFGRMGRFCRNCKTVWGGLSIGKTDVGRKTLERMFEEANKPTDWYLYWEAGPRKGSIQRNLTNNILRVPIGPVYEIAKDGDSCDEAVKVYAAKLNGSGGIWIRRFWTKKEGSTMTKIKLYRLETVTTTNEKGVVVNETIRKHIKDSPAFDLTKDPEAIGVFIRQNPEFAAQGTLITSEDC